MMAWQIFDKKVLHLLRDEYRIRRVTRVSANTLEDLVKKLEGVDAERCLAELKAYNAAVMTDVPFNPAIKDGRGTRGLKVAKSNWANVLDEPPFGDLTVGDNFQTHCYLLGLMVNARGERFVAAGSDFRNYTYARYVQATKDQPAIMQWPILATKLLHLLPVADLLRRAPTVSVCTVEDLA